MKKRVVVIGAGLCGSVLSAMLRNHFQVTVVEQSRKKRALYHDIKCAEGEINSSINRAAGLGGTTNYWHNALIELTKSDLQSAGIDASIFADYYAKAWNFFLSDAEQDACRQIESRNRSDVRQHACEVAHMVVPYARANAWELANKRYPGDAINVVYGNVEKIESRGGDVPACAVIKGESGVSRLEADYFLVCAGGLSSPAILARSLEMSESFCPGYHDHPMAYVAKVKLRPESILRSVSCHSTAKMDVRSGFVYEENGIKVAFYLRPALDLSLKSITGPARYILSDLRNDPLSVKKIFQLLTNLDAVKEAVLFKMKAGFRGDHYSVLLLGEQRGNDSRGLAVHGNELRLNWQVLEEEREVYRRGFDRFLADFSDDIAARNVLSQDRWEYRTAAHHSGGSAKFTQKSDDMGKPFFAIRDMPNVYVCDASLLRAGGIANSGLTLVALAHRLADLMKNAPTEKA